MQVQKITFTPTFKTQQIKKYNQNISNPIQDNSRLDNIDYSKIAFGSIYNVKPKKLNIELEKTKLLRQINELLNTKEKGTMTNNDISLETIYRRIIGIFRANENLQEKILYKMMDLTDPEELIHALKTECCSEEGQTIRCYYGKKEEVLHLNLHKHQLAVDKIQTFLDKYLKDNSGCIDYIHGEDVLKELSKEEQTIGIELPAMEKDQLFPSVMTDGTLPRKTFSMGHACEKRYYIEGRKIQR